MTHGNDVEDVLEDVEYRRQGEGRHEVENIEGVVDGSEHECYYGHVIFLLSAILLLMPYPLVMYFGGD